MGQNEARTGMIAGSLEKSMGTSNRQGWKIRHQSLNLPKEYTMGVVLVVSFSAFTDL